MAPIKPRFSLKSYAGRKKAKPSLNFIEEDPFDILLRDNLKKSNIFESSSEPSCSSRTEGKKSNEFCFSPGNNSSVQKSFGSLKTIKGKASVKKKKREYSKTRVGKAFENFESDCYHDVSISTCRAVSTPNRLSPFTSLVKGTKFKVTPKRLMAVSVVTPEMSPICQQSQLQDTGQSSDEYLPLSNPSSCGSGLRLSYKKLWSLSRCRQKPWNLTLDDEKSDFHSFAKEDVLASDPSFNDIPVANDLDDKPSVSASLGDASSDSNQEDDVKLHCKTNEDNSYEQASTCEPPFAWRITGMFDEENSPMSRNSFGSDPAEFPRYRYKNSTCQITVRKKRDSGLKRQSDSYGLDSLNATEPSPSSDSHEDNNSKGSSLSENFEFSSEHSSHVENASAIQEEREMAASVLKRPNFTHINSPMFHGYPSAERVQRTKHSNNSSLVQPGDEMRKTDIDRRRIYQRLSRSLPASFKDSTPLYGERGGVIDIDLRRSRKTFARMKDEPFSCSTRSLPAVLEDQDLESSTDEEFQTPRGSLHFRKSSFDQSVNSPLFLGFSSVEKVKKRSFIFKKHSDSKIIGSTLINSNVSCTSPHKLPVVQEDDSDSSCDSGDDSKKLESELESPLISPSVQTSPSRRENARLSASNSSETSLSSRSEGITSPLQDDISSTPPRSSSPELAAASSEEDSGSSPIRREEQARRRRPSRLTSKRTLGYIAEESESDVSEIANLSSINNKRFVLMPGKKYRKSLAIVRNHILGEESISYENKGRNYQEMVKTVKQLQKEEYAHLDSDDSSDMSPESRRSTSRTSLSNLSSRFSATVYSDELSDTSPDSIKSANFKTTFRQTSARARVSVLDISSALGHLSISPLELSESIQNNEISFNSETVILHLSDQTSPLAFGKLYSDGSLCTWKKIGDGVYSEVFSLSRNNQPLSVLKIIPVDGETAVCGGSQKSLDENLNEVLISKFLSDLRDSEENRCEGFVKLLKIWYIEGSYPDPLIELWNEFNVSYGSDNDNPVIFPSDQKYLALELENAGKALESYKFSSARQSISIFKQVALSLAVAETSLEFEHRDLHWGNILVDKTKEKSFEYMINSDKFTVASNGLKATIIDYTWSSLTYSHNKFRITNDMESDPDLFIGKGDLQFDIYRQMREDVERDWVKFRPKTNVRWLYYLADKLINKSVYQRSSTNAHKEGLASLQNILESIPSCNSSMQVALKLREIN